MRFGKLLVVKRDNNRKGYRPYWVCQCDCGVTKIVSGDHLKRGNIKSCGCSRKTHGQTTNRTKSQAYSIWDSMIQRCTNKNSPVWKYYGGRGITVCRHWLDFSNFLADMGNPPTHRHQIDRMDNDKSYHPSNCRWVVSKINNRNRSNNHILTYGGKTQCLSAWAEEYNIGCQVLSSRLRSDWSIRRALTTQVREYKRKGIDKCLL